MGFLSALDINASGLTAQKMRMDILAQNIANADTTRTAEGGPYRRKMVVLEENDSKNFRRSLTKAQENQNPGVHVKEVVEDQRDLNPEYDPTHPDADADGYVWRPNVDKVKEMADLMSASRAYQANVTAFNAIKSMAGTALEIGK